MRNPRVVTTFLVVLAFVAAANPTGASQATTPRYTSDQAKDHAGEYATVEGRVFEVRTPRRATTFINFGAPYPRNTFAAVVSSLDSAKFRDLSSLEGATVQVTGVIQLYRGTPEIILKEPAQLRVVASSPQGKP